ncbi:MAG: 5'-3' exonuclease H3TH domain-containing protein [Patescibacteria group bacterium]|nr:5'-3' exonuclease H3TH domain-containing protein [Patescibacteria group bacterium]
MVDEKKKLIIIDSNSIIHRTYHALPPLTTKKGEKVSAVYGFLLVFFKVIKEFQPDFIAATFDFPAPTFRHKKFKEYKAKRPPAPEELYQQIPKVKEVLKAFNVPIFEKEGFEADDIIGTIAKAAPKKQAIPPIETIILSGDLDTLQLVNEKTKVYTLRKGVKDIVFYDKIEVEKKYGILPNQLLDFKALRGDPSDNIPGVTGIGEKTAIELIKEFGSLENLYKELEDSSQKTKKLKPKLREILLKYKEQAFFSKALAKIEKDVPVDFNLKKCQWEKKYNRKRITQILKRLEFQTLIKRLPELTKSKQNGKIKKVNVDQPRSKINLQQDRQKTLF